MPRFDLELNDEREKLPVPIAGDGVLVISGVADGRAIPVIILDTSDRQDVDEVIRAHEHFGPGDATTIWSPRRWPRDRTLRLIIAFQRPQRCVIVLHFDTVAQGGIVDTIVQNELVYLLPGRPGDRLSSSMQTGRVLIEVPSAHFAVRWNLLMREQLAKSLKKQRIPRREIRSGVDAVIQDWRNLWSKRMRNESGGA